MGTVGGNLTRVFVFCVYEWQGTYLEWVLCLYGKVLLVCLCLGKKRGGGLPENMEMYKIHKSGAKQACFCLTLVPDR